MVTLGSRYEKPNYATRCKAIGSYRTSFLMSLCTEVMPLDLINSELSSVGEVLSTFTLDFFFCYMLIFLVIDLRSNAYSLSRVARGGLLRLAVGILKVWGSFSTFTGLGISFSFPSSTSTSGSNESASSYSSNYIYLYTITYLLFKFLLLLILSFVRIFFSLIESHVINISLFLSREYLYWRGVHKFDLFYLLVCHAQLWRLCSYHIGFRK